MNKILAIDPSICNTGWVVMGFDRLKGWIEIEKGVIRTKSEAKKKGIRKTDDNFSRLVYIIENLCEIVERHPDIKAMVFEMSVGAMTASAASTLAQSKACMAAIKVFYNLPAFHFLPQEMKSHATGNKNATKAQMIKKALMDGIKFDEYKSSRSKDGWNGEVEHMADAYGAFAALLKTEPLVAMLEV